MAWQVVLCDEFEPEFDALPSPLQDELLAHLKVLEAKGPLLGRPLVDTLKGCTLTNLKDSVFRGITSRFDIFSPLIPSAPPLCLWAAARQVTSDFMRK